MNRNCFASGSPFDVENGSRTSSNRNAFWRAAAGLFGLVFVVFATFGRVVTFDFVRWDDDINITQNPLLTSPWSADLLRRFFDADQALRFKPLHWFVDRALVAMFGFDPVAWHAINLLLHGLATVLFYCVLRRLISLATDEPGDGDGRNDLFALLGALVWALHPLRAEVVAWATASTYAFTAVWLLASFACYLEAQVRTRRRGVWLACSWLLATAAYASYPVSLTYALLLVVADGWLRRRRVTEKTAIPWRRWVWFLAPAIVAAGFTLWSRFAHPGIFTGAPTLETVSVGSRVMTALASLTFLAWRLIWPFGLTPNVPPIALTFDSLWAIVILAALALGGVFLVWRGRREHPGLAAVGFGFVVLCLPCLGLTERPTWPVDRYSYVAHLPLIAGITCFAAIRVRRSTADAPAIGVALLLLAILAVGGARQTSIWRDSEALFTHLIADPKSANNPRQAGHIYMLWGRYEASVGRGARAVEMFGRARDVYVSAMRAAVARGNYAEALSLSTHLERYFPVEPALHRERGAWLLRLSRPAEAATELRAARTALPDDERVTQLLHEAEGGGKP